jgi:hypothetical protein
MAVSYIVHLTTPLQPEILGEALFDKTNAAGVSFRPAFYA